jgi:CMP-N-acetylneuraminic acid synthetase
MTTYAFVFARGGSKGLPGKNVRPLAGVPLLAHSIRVAQQVGRVARTYVSTDSEEIASVAREFGAGVIRRPAELATDTASEWLAWRHAVEHLRQQGEKFDVMLSLPATSPLRSVADVEQCLDCLDATTDAVVTVTPAHRNPYFNMVSRTEDGVTEVLLQSPGIHRRQDAPVVYDLTTVAYVSRPDFVMAASGLFAGRVRSVVIPKERAVDIDDLHDFIVAGALYRTENP